MGVGLEFLMLMGVLTDEEDYERKKVDFEC